jgi:hypothetical protein
MKSFLRNFLVLAAALLGTCAFAQSTLVPISVIQKVYIDSNQHSVPYAIVTPRSGLTTVVFDPSTSSVDQAAAFGHEQKTWGGSGGSSNAPLQLVVASGVVNTAIARLETRTSVPFAITASTTLNTIPFNSPAILQTNGHYRFRADLFINAGGGGTKIDVGGTCNTSNFVANYRGYGTTTIVYGGQLTSFLSGPAGSASAVTEIVIEGELDVTNGGTFVVQFAQSGSNASASTVLAGSTLTVVQIP